MPQAQIEAAMEQVCTLLPSAFRDQCTTLIKTYGPVIIQLLEQELRAGQICQSIGLCKNATEGLFALKSNSFKRVYWGYFG